MKREYEEPKVVIIHFEEEDIICTSCSPDHLCAETSDGVPSDQIT